MAKIRKAIRIESLTHDEAKRRNIPTAEMQAIYAREPAASPVTLSYPRATPLAPGERRERNPDLDPQLVWRGKDEQDWSDLVVHAPPLYIQEKIHPKVIIEDLRREAQRRRDEADDAPDLFADFNGLPDGEARLEFYQHDQNWSNRMILGDSLQVMASLPSARACAARSNASTSTRPTASASTPTGRSRPARVTSGMGRLTTSAVSRNRLRPSATLGSKESTLT